MLDWSLTDNEVSGVLLHPWLARRRKIIEICWRDLKLNKNIYLCLSNMQKGQSFYKKWCRYIIWVSNNLDLKWGPHFVGVSWSFLFENFVKGLQNPSVVRKELFRFEYHIHWKSMNINRWKMADLQKQRLLLNKPGFPADQTTNMYSFSDYLVETYSEDYFI